MGLVWVDINYELQLLASQLELPREVHIDAVFCIYSCLRWKYNQSLNLDPTYPTIDIDEFKEFQWKQLYKNVKESIPFDAPGARSKDNRWELPGDYPVFALVMAICHYVDRIWRILVTPNFLYNI